MTGMTKWRWLWAVSSVLMLVAIFVGSIWSAELPRRIERLPSFLPHPHLLAYALVAVPVTAWLGGHWRAAIIAVLGLTVLGAAIEVVQWFLPWRGGRVSDAAINAAGATLGAASVVVVVTFSRWLSRRIKRAEEPQPRARL